MMRGAEAGGSPAPLKTFMGNETMLTNWTTITEAQVRARLSGRELEAFRSRNSSPGEEDPLQAILDSVTEKVRGAIASVPQTRLGPAGTIPAVLLYDALSIVVMDMMARVGGVIMDEGGHRKTAYETAMRLFNELIPRGDGPVIPFPEEEDTTVAKQTVTPRYYAHHEETMRRDQTDG